jgi:hypothetical protein
MFDEFAYKCLRRIVDERICRAESKDEHNSCHRTRSDVKSPSMRLKRRRKRSEDREDHSARKWAKDESRSATNPVVRGCADYGAEEGTDRVDEIEEQFYVLRCNSRHPIHKKRKRKKGSAEEMGGLGIRKAIHPISLIKTGMK